MEREKTTRKNVFGLILVRDIGLSGERKKICLRRGKENESGRGGNSVMNGKNATLNVYSEVYSILNAKQYTSTWVVL